MDYYFQIYAGELSDHYDRIFCGYDSINYTTSSDLITIEFFSNGGTTASGFRIEFGGT